MLIPRQAYAEVGGLDEGHFMYAEDVELCYVMQQRGWQVWYHPGAKVIHLGGGSSRRQQPQREANLYRGRVQFFRRHYGAGQANLLKMLIYAFTLLKIVIHSVLRAVSFGRWGRTVVGLRLLHGVLSKV